MIDTGAGCLSLPNLNEIHDLLFTHIPHSECHQNTEPTPELVANYDEYLNVSEKIIIVKKYLISN